MTLFKEKTWFLWWLFAVVLILAMVSCVGGEYRPRRGKPANCYERQLLRAKTKHRTFTISSPRALDLVLFHDCFPYICVTNGVAAPVWWAVSGASTCA